MKEPCNFRTIEFWTIVSSNYWAVSSRRWQRTVPMAYLGFGKGGCRTRRTRAYNGDLRAEPPARSRGRAFGQGDFLL